MPLLARRTPLVALALLPRPAQRLVRVAGLEQLRQTLLQVPLENGRANRGLNVSVTDASVPALKPWPPVHPLQRRLLQAAVHLPQKARLLRPGPGEGGARADSAIVLANPPARQLPRVLHHRLKQPGKQLAGRPLLVKLEQRNDSGLDVRDAAVRNF